eukprot:CCRYP_018900-RA/>CCRYP_018900-RA protein AED:0.03 eAED:0.03 QI:1172/1/1/1/0/0/3/156/68
MTLKRRPKNNREGFGKKTGRRTHTKTNAVADILASLSPRPTCALLRLCEVYLHRPQLIPIVKLYEYTS